MVTRRAALEELAGGDRASDLIRLRGLLSVVRAYGPLMTDN